MCVCAFVCVSFPPLYYFGYQNILILLAKGGKMEPFCNFNSPNEGEDVVLGLGWKKAEVRGQCWLH